MAVFSRLVFDPAVFDTDAAAGELAQDSASIAQRRRKRLWDALRAARRARPIELAVPIIRVRSKVLAPAVATGRPIQGLWGVPVRNVSNVLAPRIQLGPAPKKLVAARFRNRSTVFAPAVEDYDLGTANIAILARRLSDADRSMGL